VAEEMEWLYRQGFNTFVFNESDLHGDPKLIERLCDEIIQRRMKVNMTCQLRCHPKVDKAYFQKMREAGFVCLRFGIDGGSTNALRLQRKGYPKEVVRRNLKDAAEAGIYTEVNLVIGVPGETEEDIDETIDFFGELKNTIGRLAYINPLMLFRGSEYWEHPERFGIVFRSDKEELYRTYPVAVPDHEWYSTDPYIDRDIRYTRLKRVVIALRKMGVPLGEFADYTAERIGEAGKDLANTHNAKNDLTREACPSKQKERQAPGPLEISKSQTTTTHPHTPCEIKLKGSEKILLIGTGTQQSVRSTLERLEYYNDITLLIPQGNAHHWPGYQTFEFSNNGRFIPQLREQHFDMVIVLYDHRLGKMAFEKFASQFVNQLLAVFSNGQMRLYPNDHLSRVVYNMAYLRSLFNYVPNLRGKRILEVGCSDGLVCDLMTHEDPEEIIGIDLLETVGCNYPGPKITYARMDASNLDFADQSFDLCYSIATLEHCKDPFKVLQEMKRVTKKGGTCYVQAGPLYYSPFGHHMFGYFDDIPWIHLRSSKEEILAYASKRGIDQKVKTTVGVHLSDYLDGMLNKEHINEKSFAEYRLPEFMASPHIDVLNFSRSYEGKEFLNEQVLTELSRISPDDLVTHGFELVFGVKG
jgi:SAM-dependent methyltransferase